MIEFIINNITTEFNDFLIHYELYWKISDKIILFGKKDEDNEVRELFSLEANYERDALVIKLNWTIEKNLYAIADFKDYLSSYLNDRKLSLVNIEDEEEMLVIEFEYSVSYPFDEYSKQSFFSKLSQHVDLINEFDIDFGYTLRNPKKKNRMVIN